MKKLSNIAVVIALWFLSGLFCLGQTTNTRNWGYNINSVSSFTNKEYNSNSLKGYTLGGSWLKTGLTYNINNTLFLSGGIYFHSFFGDAELQSRHPFLLKAVYRPNENFSISFGDIHSHENHYLPNYLYNSDLLLLDPIEEGISVNYSNTKLYIETWIDWEKYIVSGSPFREEFLFGTTAQYKLIDFEKNSNTLNFAVLIKHKGGEIDASPLTVQTLLNTRLGFSQLFRFNNTASLNFGSDLINYINNSGTPEIPIKSGYAFTIYGGVQLNDWQLVIDYWHSNKFYSIKGDSYYSNYINTEISPQRNIISFSQIWKKNISESASIAFNNNLLYDFSKTKMDLYSTLKLVVFINNHSFH